MDVWSLRLLHIVLDPTDGGSDVLQVHGGEEGGHELILKQGPRSVPPPILHVSIIQHHHHRGIVPGLAHHLSGHGEEPLEYVLCAWWPAVPPLVPGAGGPQQ